MKLRWSKLAARDLTSICRHIRLEDPAAAQRVGRRIRAAAEKLTLFPELGRIGSVRGTREKLALPYPFVLVYEINPLRAEIFILRVYHMAQDRP